MKPFLLFLLAYTLASCQSPAQNDAVALNAGLPTEPVSDEETVAPEDPVLDLETEFDLAEPIEVPTPGGVRYAVINEIPLPEGYQRVTLPEDGFGQYLRDFPLRNVDTVYLYNGTLKWSQDVHYAVIDIEIGTRDLQQCADVVMHMQADYLYKQKRYNDISFDFLTGKKGNYAAYAEGDHSLKKFMKYLVWIYSYANTTSLTRQMKEVPSMADMEVGDVFVHGGQPYGHAMIVMDMCIDPNTGKKLFMLGQGFIPAQDAEVVVNEQNADRNPWYPCEFGDILYTPQWTFRPENLHRFHKR
jgi:hypothetical protein